MFDLVASYELTAEIRGWLTFAWALIVGGGTLIGVFIGVRSYLHNAWQSKVAAARLVWCEGRGPHFAPRAGSPWHPKERPEQVVQSPATSGAILAPGLFEWGQVEGWLTTVWKVDGIRGYVRLMNNSNEPMSNVELKLRRGSTTIASRQLSFPFPRVLGPQSNCLIEVLTPRDMGGSPRTGRFVLRFTDSAGNRWERVDTRPPTLVPQPKGPRLRGVPPLCRRLVQQLKAPTARS